MQRYESAIADAGARGCKTNVDEFEAAVSISRAVIARPLIEADRLATGAHELYATFYELVDSGIRLPFGGKWDLLRRIADDAMFLNYERRIRFAALTLDSVGLSNYGECSLILRDDMIRHRASVFEENSVLFVKSHLDLRADDPTRLPRGYRANWRDRPKLCVSKLAARLDRDSRSESYAGILLRQGKSSEEDEFVEVHIWGPLTIRSIERVVVRKEGRNPSRAILGALRQRLERFGIELEER
jgi:hypothetical protein